jgi:hypothetical protein
MYENYFMTLSDYGALEHEKRMTRKIVGDLSYGGYCSWCTDDPELDNLRKAALRAMEDYHDALKNRVDKLDQRLYDKLDDSDKVINLKNLFKK